MDWPQLCIHPALLTAPLVYVENIEGDGDDDGEQLDNDSDIDKYIDNDSDRDYSDYSPAIQPTRALPLPAPIPVPNLTKKSRGRKVPSVITTTSTPSPSSPSPSTSTISQTQTSTPARSYLCPVPNCGKSFIRGEHLKRHIRSIHTHEKRTYIPFFLFCGLAD
jgi:uncharacterized Zn-finger protein